MPLAWRFHAPGVAVARGKTPGDVSSPVGNPTPRTPHPHLKWALVPVGSVLQGPRAAGRSGVEARENRGTLGPHHPRHLAAACALAIADLPPMIV